MAEEETRASPTEILRRFTGPTFRRLGRWGIAATAAVSLAYFAASSDMGLRRMASALSNVQGLPQAPPVKPRDNAEIVRLSESLRRLTNDRDRLLDRLETLEKNFDDLTGSIARNATPPHAAENVPAPVPEPSATPQVIPPNTSAVLNAPPGPTAPTQQSTPVPPPQESAANDVAKNPPNPTTTKVDFGVDLGSAPTVEGLRTLWTSAKVKHAKLLDGMRPIIALREGAQPGKVELRLVAGPLPSAAVAARLCVVIITAGTVCQPAVFDGQRLAMR